VATLEQLQDYKADVDELLTAAQASLARARAAAAQPGLDPLTTRLLAAQAGHAEHRRMVLAVQSRFLAAEAARVALGGMSYVLVPTLSGDLQVREGGIRPIPRPSAA
jgi:hypothetical protein